jgi:hypothetical protein
MRVVLSTVVLHIRRGDMKGKAERVSSAKVIKKTRRKEKARAEPMNLWLKSKAKVYKEMALF